MAKVDWERVEQDSAGYLERAEVPGGWLVRETNDVLGDDPNGGMASGWSWTSSITFVPDPNHEWN